MKTILITILIIHFVINLIILFFEWLIGSFSAEGEVKTREALKIFFIGWMLLLKDKLL